MSINYIAEVEIAMGERKALCFQARGDKERFLSLAQESGLFEDEQDALNCWEGFHFWEEAQDQKGHDEAGERANQK